MWAGGIVQEWLHSSNGGGGGEGKKLINLGKCRQNIVLLKIRLKINH